ncbi:MAG: hypothetical protein HY820_46170 [Acidobacteria bacterium]|nr:hypothetical protein [Acidobacteriota bacterium]
MATEKQITANRLNAQLSTGPRTEEGKARVARNALRDGFYSKALVILPGFEQEFQLLRDQLLDSFKPSAGVQDAIFDEIVIASWNLRRAAFSENDIYNKQADPDTDPLTDDRHEAKLRRIRQFARQNQTAREKAVKLLSDLQTEVRSRLQSFPPDETVETPVMDQTPQSFSVLCRLQQVVKAIKDTRGYKSAPVAGSNKADSRPAAAKSNGQLLRKLVAAAENLSQTEVTN